MPIQAFRPERFRTYGMLMDADIIPVSAHNVYGSAKMGAVFLIS